MTETLPFIGSLLLVATSVSASRQIRREIDGNHDSLSGASKKSLDPSLRPESLTSFVSAWAARAQAPALLLPPLLGLVILDAGSRPWGLAAISLFVATASLVWLYAGVDVWLYQARAGNAGLGLFEWATVALNALGLASVLLG